MESTSKSHGLRPIVVFSACTQRGCDYVQQAVYDAQAFPFTLLKRRMSLFLIPGLQWPSHAHYIVRLVLKALGHPTRLDILVRTANKIPLHGSVEAINATPLGKSKKRYRRG